MEVREEFHTWPSLPPAKESSFPVVQDSGFEQEWGWTFGEDNRDNNSWESEHDLSVLLAKLRNTRVLLSYFLLVRLKKADFLNMIHPRCVLLWKKEQSYLRVGLFAVTGEQLKLDACKFMSLLQIQQQTCMKFIFSC